MKSKVRDLERNVATAPSYLRVMKKHLAQWQAIKNPDKTTLKSIEHVSVQIAECERFINNHP